MPTTRPKTTAGLERATEDELVRQHLPLVQRAVSDIASRVPRQVPRDDLISAGMIGLTQAARSYDAERGITFERYAARRVRGAVIDELRSRDWASRSVRTKARHVSRGVDVLTGELGRAPTTAETGLRLGLTESSLSAISGDVHRAVVLSYDSVLIDGEAEDILPADTRSPEVVLLDRERHAYLADAIAGLPERLRRVVIGYFFDERPMIELAEELGVSESRISQMRAEALALIKDGMNSQLDPESVPVAERATGRVARRKAAYFRAVADASDWRARLTARPITLRPRLERRPAVA